MSRWNKVKNAQSTGSKNYLTVGSYILALELFKYRNEQKKEYLAVECTVVECLTPGKVTLMRGKGQEKAQETRSKDVGERASLVWSFGNDWDDSLWGEVKELVCAAGGMTVAQMDAAEAEHAELLGAGKKSAEDPSPFDELMDLFVADDGEQVKGFKFKADIAKVTARGGHHYTKGSYSPVAAEAAA